MKRKANGKSYITFRIDHQVKHAIEVMREHSETGIGSAVFADVSQSRLARAALLEMARTLESGRKD